MSSLDNISPDEFLHAYLDQELDQADEQELYALLASDSALHLKLRELRSIRDEALKSGGVLPPPAEVTQRLFASIGMAEMTDHGAGTATVPLLDRFRRSAVPFAAAASAAFLVGLVLFSLLRQPVADIGTRPFAGLPESSTSSGQMSTDRQATADAVPPAGLASAAPVRTPRSTRHAAPGHREESDAESGIPATDARYVTNVPAADHSTGASTDAGAEKNAASTHAGEAPVDASKTDQPVRRSPQNTRSENSNDPVYYADLEPVEPDGLVSVEFRGLTMSSFPAATMPTAADPWMQNLAFAAYYSWSNSAIGIEYGQEPFSQHYSGTENGRFVRYEQNLLTSWITANYRYTFGSMLGVTGLRPYATAAIGSSFQLWPVTRASVGLMYLADRRVRFHLAADASLMAYPFDNSWFTSSRAGISYGISVLF